MNKELKEKVLQDYEKDEILINQTNFTIELIVFILPPIVITLLISLVSFPELNLLLSFLVIYHKNIKNTPGSITRR